MRTFAFIVCPKTIKHLKSLIPATRLVPDFILKSRLKSSSPFKVSHLKKIRSTQGKEIQGYFIACPLISQSGQKLDEESILAKILSAANIAVHLGTNILGLDRNVSITIEKLNIPLTNGDTLTAWSIFEAVYRVARVKNIDLKNSTVLVIGAGTAAGSLCARKLSEYAAKIILNANNSDKLRLVKEAITAANDAYSRPTEVIIERDLDKAIKEADIIIDLEGMLPLLFDATEKLKPGAIICAFAKTISRQDITVINAGLIKLPYPDKLGINLGLTGGVIPASIAETMLLALEDKLINYSWGEQVNPDKLEEIANIATRHGFEVWVPEAPVL